MDENKLNQSFGSEIRKYRKDKGESLAKASEALEINRSYLNKIELDISRPSARVLDLMIAHFSLEGNKVSNLLQLWGRKPLKVVVSETGRKEQNMDEKVVSKKQPAANVNVSIDPNTRPVLYSESVFIQSSDFGLTMDFAQQIGATDQQFVVARIGMSHEHAKKMLEVLSDHLQKNER